MSLRCGQNKKTTEDVVFKKHSFFYHLRTFYTPVAPTWWGEARPGPIIIKIYNHTAINE